MLVLALDTTTPSGSVAVVRDDTLLVLVEGDGSRTHGERLPAEIDTALVRAGVAKSAVDLLAVASGPGAFTGLRIGLAAIQGLAMVLGRPVAGVSALDALAHAVFEQDSTVVRVATWADAQRGEVFAASYSAVDADGAIDGSAPTVSSPQVALAALPFAANDAVTFAGAGALKYRGLIRSARGHAARIFEPTPSLAPAIAHLAQRLAAQGLAGPPHALQPLYVRRPDAEIDRGRQARP